MRRELEGLVTAATWDKMRLYFEGRMDYYCYKMGGPQLNEER